MNGGARDPLFFLWRFIMPTDKRKPAKQGKSRVIRNKPGQRPTDPRTGRDRTKRGKKK